MKRTRERDIDTIKAEIQAAENEAKAAQKRKWALESELNNHSITVKQEKDKDLARLKAQLPAFLFDKLVAQGDPQYGSLTQVYMGGNCGWEGESVTRFTEISLYFSKGGRYHCEINTDDGIIEDARDISYFQEPKFVKPIETLWAKAMKANENDCRKALAATMICTARKLDDPEPASTFLKDVFDK